jgi:acetolactate synthase regulatory subunit
MVREVLQVWTSIHESEELVKGLENAAMNRQINKEMENMAMVVTALQFADERKLQLAKYTDLTAVKIVSRPTQKWCT